METAKIIRDRCPEAHIVFGGHHPTGMPEEVLRHDCVDFIIRGEGEDAMAPAGRCDPGKWKY